MNTVKYPHNFQFVLKEQATTSKARTGTLITPHGAINTPAFIFCATKAAIRSVAIDDLQATNTQIILSNTYHLMLQPGASTVAHFGGLHKFMGWNGPMLTDSGGFQIFSLGHGSVADEIKGRRRTNREKTLLKITEEGAIFRSYIDGKIHTLTPESAMEIQQQLGADLVLVFDECTPFNVTKEYTQAAMQRSHRWAMRSLNKFNTLNQANTQALYGIVQGGVYPDLRSASCNFVNSQPFFGHAIGGSLGSNKAQMYDIVGYTKQQLDPARPCHLLGIGDLDDLFFGVAQGIDTFDCVHPTRSARHGSALVRSSATDAAIKKNHIHLTNKAYKLDPEPIASDCSCLTCQKYSKGYLHHLLKAKELLAFQLISIHNITFMNTLMAAIRQAIATDTLEIEKKRWLN